MRARISTLMKVLLLTLLASDHEGFGSIANPALARARISWDSPRKMQIVRDRGRLLVSESAVELRDEEFGHAEVNEQPRGIDKGRDERC